MRTRYFVAGSLLIVGMLAIVQAQPGGFGGFGGGGPTSLVTNKAVQEDLKMTEEQVREMVVHLTHYIGWPLSTGVNEVAERVIAARRKAERAG